MEQHKNKVQGASRVCYFSTTSYVFYAAPLIRRVKGMAFTYDLSFLKSREQLIGFLEIDERDFEKVLFFTPGFLSHENHQSHSVEILDIPQFFRHEIPKKNRDRGHRIVWEATYLKNNYKALARRLGIFFEQKIKAFPHERAFGFTVGRNIRENAKDHCGHKNLVSLDIRDFFPSIKVERVEIFFASLGLTQEVANLLSRFVTIDGSLPLGLATSPVIANALCLPIDIELSELAQKFEATYSRYADDISFSSNKNIPDIETIQLCIQKNNFELAESKTRKSKLGQSHYVTGLSVSDKSQPHAPRSKKRNLRQQLYYCKKFGLDDHLRHLGITDSQVTQIVVNHIDGMVKYIAFHEPRLSGQLKSTWTDILKRSGGRPSFAPKNQERTPFHIYVDEAEFVMPNGIRLLALGLSVSQHQDKLNLATEMRLEKTTSDIWAAGNRDAIIERGLHFTDATEDIKLAYVEQLQQLPFEGYVAFVELQSPALYEAKYLALLNSVIRRRLMAAESKAAYLVFEINSKVSETSVRNCVRVAYKYLENSNNRRPKAYFVEFVGKPNPGMSVPDFLLGVLGKFLKSGADVGGTPISRDKLMFERLRDKYRLIFDLDSGVEYSRRNSISPW